MEAVAIQYARLFHEAGHVSFLLCHRRFNLATLAGVKRIMVSSAILWNPFSYIALWLVLRKIRPDQVWCHGARALSLCRLIRFAMPRGMRIVAVAHNGRSVKVGKADITVAVSPSVRNELVGKLGISAETMVCAPNAIPIPAEPSMARHNPPVVGFLGRIDPIKGIDTLLTAADLLTKRGVKFRLLMAGSGPQENVYRDQCRELGLTDRISWMGWIRDKKRFFDAVDVFCIPSYSEGMPLSLLEAMAYGRPVVGSDCAAVKTMVEQSRAGVVFPAGNASALAIALEKLLKAEDDEYRALSQRARDFVSVDYSETRLLKDLTTIVKAIGEDRVR